MNHKIFALVGPYASGKASIINQLMAAGIHYIHHYTTAAYHDHKAGLFVQMTPEAFAEESFIIRSTYLDQQYALKREEILTALQQHNISVMILPLHSIAALKKLLKSNLATVFLMCDYVNLVDRMLRLRHSNDEIKKHLQYAESNKEFEGWKQCNFVIKNSGDMNLALQQLLAIMGLVCPLPREEFMKAL